MLHSSLLVMNRQNKTEYAIFISLMWSLLPKDLLIKTYFSVVFFFAYIAFENVSH